jgi:ketosteroid isomerase-like protein
MVAGEGTAAGRHRTLHLRIPARTPVPQRAYRHGFAVFLEVQRGKIRRHRVYYDSRDLVRQLLGGG